jgi:hypothetical protein
MIGRPPAIDGSIVQLIQTGSQHGTTRVFVRGEEYSPAVEEAYLLSDGTPPW